MELGEKLKQLRKSKGLTQEELAALLYVSRTAVSKWESGKGFPNIDSLKHISALFDISVDSLLSGDELLTIAEADSKQKETRLCDRVFSLLDISAALLLFLPFFADKTEGAVQAVSLLQLENISPYLKTAYSGFVCAGVVLGFATLALHSCTSTLWQKSKTPLSLALTAAGCLLFIISLQPYGAVFLFAFLIIKAVFVIKGP